MSIVQRVAHILLGIFIALSLPVFGHRKHETPRCPKQPTTRSGPRKVAKYIRCVARIVPGFDVPKALEVARCESGLNPRARSSGGHLGVYQHDQDYWPKRAATYGFEGHSALDPVANIKVAAFMVRDAGWGAWSCA